MSLLALGALSLAGSVASSLIGQKNAADKTAAGRKALDEYFNKEYYRRPGDDLGTNALLKLRKERREDDLESIENRAAAGGATMENMLAARKELNRADSEFDSQLLLQQDAKRQALNQHKLQADQQAYAQDAQNWQTWGQNMSNSFMQLGSLAMMGGLGGGKLLSFPKVGAVKEALGQTVLGSVASGPALNNGVVNPNTPGLIMPK